MGSALATSIAVLVLLAATRASAMHGSESSLAAWGELGEARSCQRVVAAAAEACGSSACEARAGCHEAELEGRPCDAAAVAARVQSARVAALDAIERACSEANGRRLGRVGVANLLADAVHACRSIDERLGDAPYSAPATTGPQRRCVRTTAAAARRAGGYAVRAWRRSLDRIATAALTIGQKERIAAHTAARVERVRRLLAAGLERRCGVAQFTDLYQQSPGQFLAAAAQTGACFSGAVYSQAAVTCAETAAAPAVSGRCVGGAAAGYPCSNAHLRAFLPLAALGGDSGNDVWGWTDPVSHREYVLMGLSNGTALVDISADPPIHLGNLPTHTVNSLWRGIKVYADHALVGSEASGHGMQILDLRQLRSLSGPPVTFAETAHYAGFGNSHTLAVNPETGFAFAAGSNTCSGGLHIVDVRDPRHPSFAGCVNNDGYTHDTQCVIYRGPDAAHAGREICLSSNTDTLTIVDVTDKSAPVQLSRTGYAGSGYTHQGWLTADQRYFLVDDELDERDFGHTTRTHIWDVADLDAPLRIGFYSGPTTAADHNLYVRDGYVFEANYRSGLRILDGSRVGAASLREVGFFDIYPADDLFGFNGAWSTYPFFASGLVAVSGIEQGLFVVEPALAATDTPTPTGTPVPAATAISTTTGAVLAVGDVVVTSPTEGQVIGVEGVTFQWTAAGGATGYDLRVINAATQAVIFTGSLGGGGSTTTLIGLPNSGNYTFRVRACMGPISDATCGNFATRNFTVSLVAPSAAPTIAFPGGGATLTTSQHNLSWTAVSPNPQLPTMFYEVVLTNRTTMQTEVQFRTIHPATQAAVILRSAPFRMRVRACQAGCGPFSAAVDFTVALGAVPGAAPTITNAVVSGGNSLNVSWTAVAGTEWYQVQVIQHAAGPGGGSLTVAARQVTGATNVTLPVPAGQASVIVAACNGDGCGPYSSASVVNPTQNPAAPQVGSPLGGAVVNGPSVLFAWSRIPGDTGSTLYRLFVQDLSRQRAAVDVYTTQNFYGALLKAEGGNYAVVVIANPGLANQASGAPVNFTVRGSSAVAPTLMMPTHASVVPEGNVLVGWSPVPGATLYEYLLSVQGQAAARGRGVTPGTFVQVPLMAVNGQPTLYSGIVRACPAGQTCAAGSEAGWGPWSTAAGSGAIAFTVLPATTTAGGSSLRFNGNGSGDIDRVKIKLDAPARPVDVGGDLTLEFWMKTTAGAGNTSGACVAGGDNWINGNIIFDRDVFMTGGDLGDYGIALFGTGGRLAFGVAVGASGNTICGTTSVVDGQWHHVAVTRSSLGAMRIYVDGQLDGSGSGPAGDMSYRNERTTSFPNSDPFLVIGAEKHDAGAAFPSYHGWIDEVRISDAILYAAPFTAPTAPLIADVYTVALYHFDEGNGNTAFDLSGVAGGPSNGVRRFGGSPAGPLWSADTPFTTPIPTIGLDTLTTALSGPTSITHAGDQRLFITQKGGEIRIWDGAQLLATPFLTISPVASGGEEGLLSVAFHPNYAQNGFFYVYYVDAAGNVVIARYRVSANPNIADPASGVVLLTIPHPSSNHNGGQLQFGPDGYLYAGIGDGGGGCDDAGAGCNAQRDNLMLGKMLRLDVNQNVNVAPFHGVPPTNPFVGPGDPLDLIWAKGLRNPWRFAFDRLTGSLFIGDVGQNSREEVDVQSAGSPGGENYGWKRMEGFACNTCDLSNCPVAPPACNSPLLTLPVLDYDHSLGCSISGGYVYRGTAIPNLYGKYIFGDLCSGRLWWARDNEGTWSYTQFPVTASGPWTFGQDVAGELYVGRGNGTLARLRAGP